MAGKKKYSRAIQKMRLTAKVCFYCERWLVRDDEKSPSFCTVDHIIPREKGGRGLSENLVVCCAMCNQLKGRLLPDEFVDKIKSMIQSRSFQSYTSNQLHHMLYRIEQLKTERLYLKLYHLAITDNYLTNQQ